MNYSESGPSNWPLVNITMHVFVVVLVHVFTFSQQDLYYRMHDSWFKAFSQLDSLIKE